MTMMEEFPILIIIRVLLAAVSVVWEGGGNVGNMRLCVFDFDRAFNYVTSERGQN